MVQTHFGSRREDDCPMCGRRPAAAEVWGAAVHCRPHYPPCDHPDNPCSCGAAEDRYAIAAALVEAERRGAAEALRAVAKGVAEGVEKGRKSFMVRELVVNVDELLSALNTLADALAADGTQPHPAHRHDETGAGR